MVLIFFKGIMVHFSSKLKFLCLSEVWFLILELDSEQEVVGNLNKETRQ